MAFENKVNNWICKQSFEVRASVKQFWTAIDIYTKRSHVINRRLIGGEVLGKIVIQSDQHLQNLTKILLSCDVEKNVHNELKKENNVQESDAEERDNSRVAIIKKVIPKKSSHEHCLEVVINDYTKTQVSYYNSSPNKGCVPYFPYAFSYDHGKLNLLVENDVQDSDASYQWILSKLVPKLIRWMENVEVKRTVDPSSLRLVQVTQYSTLYNKLKETYGKQLVEMWPENTDPLKFVYEDIGIATYLLLLWAGLPKQRFVDLGCGNGLLVHILNSEGHLGVGYDIRPRKIWNMYPPTTKLEVRTIIPSSETLFPDANWLIGNHSDELTVWIPVIAARSSYSCNFFLLPCCPYEFDGKKYCRANTSVSQYSNFLSYVESVCNECGICVEKDKLRIPSTKRICYIGKNRTYSESEREINLEKLQVYVDSKCVFNSCGVNERAWCPNFKPRSEEKVRNCTQIHSDVKESIVNLVAEQLLVKRRAVDDGWHFGGVVEISTLAKIVPSETLKKLKSECGGLQTLLKNHHHIFQVRSGKVEFRVPTEKLKSDSSVWKKKPCWFFHNHPNSCPLSDDKCSFVHTP